jgi:hypothetical protein
VQEVVLFLSLNDLNLELSVLLLLLHSYQFSQNVFEKVVVAEALLSLLYDFIEHIFESYHVKGCFLERELHYFGEDKYKMLDVD